MDSSQAKRTAAALTQIIKEYRQAQGLTYEDLAGLAGIHRTTIALWERSARGPTVQLALQLASALGVELSELLSRAEARVSGSAPRAARPRLVSDAHFCNEAALRQLTGLSAHCLRRAIEGTYQTLDTIDFQLQARRTLPLARLVELANISSMLGNLLGGLIAEHSGGLYQRNKPHTYPDLLPVPPRDQGIEIKIALETNSPKGHLPKPGVYLTFRYVLASKTGAYFPGKPDRGDTAVIWEARLGKLASEDFSLSSTRGDSGKTAVIRASSLRAMSVIYFVPAFSPRADLRKQTPGRWRRGGQSA